MTRVLFASSEAYPFIKTGGLADVSFALPRELRGYGVDARVIIPKYMDISEEFKNKMRFVKSFNVQVGWRNQYCGVFEMDYEGVPFYFIDNEYYFKRGGVYGFYDEAERFAFFSRAVLEFIGNMDFKPEIIHCNDWQTAMVSPLLKSQYAFNMEMSGIKTVFTIHNLKYQGIYGPEVLGDLFGLGYEHMNTSGLEFYGDVNIIKGGLNYTDAITTVSDTYAMEIQDPYYGERLDGVLRSKSSNLHGILNGIDYKIYDPSTDTNIVRNYDADSASEGKTVNKLEIMDMLDLNKSSDIPLIGMVSRLTDQKGLDLLEHIMKDLMENTNASMVILGTGEQEYENSFRYFASMYPGRLSVNLKFDNKLAHMIYASCDMFLMPSKFEPCGLSQLISLRYGTLPIVRETGGLRDTVTSYNKYTGEGNGFSFSSYNAHEMLYTIERAVELYKDKKTWDSIVKTAMKEDFSWKKSALMYKSLYSKILNNSL